MAAQMLLTGQFTCTVQEFATIKSHLKDVPNLMIYVGLLREMLVDFPQMPNT
jgi:hypothetical protein